MEQKKKILAGVIANKQEEIKALKKKTENAKLASTTMKCLHDS